METLLHILDRYGLPTAFLAAGLYLIVRLAKWMGPNLMIPLRDAHLSMVENLGQTQNRLADGQEQLGRTLESQGKTLERLADLHADNTDDLRRIREAMAQEEDAHG